MLARPEISEEALADIAHLEKVRARLERKWGRGNYEHCLVGACRAVLEDTVWRVSLDPEKRAAERRFVQNLGLGNVGLTVAYNDTPGRTLEQVLARLDSAIERRRERALRGE